MAQQYVTAICYDKRGRVISTGKNSYVKTHPLQASYAKSAGYPHKIFLHAEVDAMIKARGKEIHKIVVFRTNKAGEYVNAKPCPSCQLAIEAFGVKVVEHT